MTSDRAVPPPVRSRDAPARAGRVARGDEQLARTAHARHMEGLVICGQQLLHPAHAGGDLGERAGDCRPDAESSLFGEPKPGARMTAAMSYSLLMIDRDYVTRELLPSLAEQHFGHAATQGSAPGLDFKVAVVSRAARRTRSSFSPRRRSLPRSTRRPMPRPISFRSGRRTSRRSPPRSAGSRHWRPQHGPTAVAGTARFSVTETTQARPLSIMIQPGLRPGPGIAPGAGAATKTTEARLTAGISAPHWKLVVTHPSGSLEAAVSSQRRRNLAISSSVLGLLGASMGLLVLATRRAQRLAQAADGVRRGRLARAAHAAGRDPIGGREPRRRRRPRRGAHPALRRADAGRRPAPDRDGRADPRARRHPVGPARVCAAARRRRAAAARHRLGLVRR